MAAPSSVDSEVSRRGFLVVLGGVSLGMFALQGWEENEALTGLPDRPQPEHVPAQRVKRMLFPPSRDELSDGRLMLFWTDTDGESHVWTAETPAEKREAERFFAAANAQPAFVFRSDSAPIVEPTLAQRVGEWLGISRRSAQERKLLQAIIDAPYTNPPLLAYADWLTAQGEIQGEYIRLLHEYRHTPQDDPRKAQLKERTDLIYEENKERWAEPLLRLGMRPVVMDRLMLWMWMYQGVIVDAVIEQPGLLPERTGLLFEVIPLLRKLTVKDRAADVASIVMQPELAQLETLAFEGCPFSTSLLGRLSDTPHLPRVDSLSLRSAGLTAADLPVLLNSHWPGRLNVLDLSGNPIGDEGLAALLQVEWKQLYMLVLNDTGVSAAGIRALAQSPLAEQIRYLYLADNPLGVYGMVALVESRPAWKKLEILGLRAADAGNEVAWNAIRKVFPVQ